MPKKLMQVNIETMQQNESIFFFGAGYNCLPVSLTLN